MSNRGARNFAARIMPLVCGLTAGVLASAVALTGYAQNYPNKPVRLIIPYGPGGTGDVVPRMYADAIGRDLGATFVVENKPGGLAMPAINDVLGNPADGYTIMASDSGQWAINPAMGTVSGYDFLRDFAPVARIYANALVLFTSGTNSHGLKDFIAQEKAKPGTMNYGAAGVGTPHHLIVAVMASRVGTNMQAIQFKSAPEIATATVNGTVQFSSLGLGGLVAFAKEGRVRLLAVTTKERQKQIPDVPTVEELIGQPFDFPTGQGFVVRAGTPRPIIDRLAASMRKAAAQPDFYNRIFTIHGATPVPTTPEDYLEVIRADIKNYADAVKTAGIK